MKVKASYWVAPVFILAALGLTLVALGIDYSVFFGGQGFTDPAEMTVINEQFRQMGKRIDDLEQQLMKHLISDVRGSSQASVPLPNVRGKDADTIAKVMMPAKEDRFSLPPAPQDASPIPDSSPSSRASGTKPTLDRGSVHSIPAKNQGHDQGVSGDDPEIWTKKQCRSGMVDDRWLQTETPKQFFRDALKHYGKHSSCVCPESLNIEGVHAQKCIFSQMASFRKGGRTCTNCKFSQELTMFCPAAEKCRYTVMEVDMGEYGSSANMPLADGDVVVDIGANLGFFSILVALAHPNVKVLAFEVNPFTFKFLQQNIQANGVQNRVLAQNRGLSKDGHSFSVSRCQLEAHGTVHFSIDAEKKCHGNNKQSECYQVLKKIQEQNREKDCKHDMVELPTLPFPEVINIVQNWASKSSGSAKNNEASIRFLKVDCEGCEHWILPDMCRYLKSQFAKNHQAFVAGECHPSGEIVAGTKALLGCKEVVHRIKNRTLTKFAFKPEHCDDPYQF